MSSSRVHNSKHFSIENRPTKRCDDGQQARANGARKHVQLEIIYQCILCGRLTEDLWMIPASDPSSQAGSTEEQNPIKYALCDFCETLSDRKERVELEIAAQMSITDGDAL